MQTQAGHQWENTGDLCSKLYITAYNISLWAAHQKEGRKKKNKWGKKGLKTTAKTQSAQGPQAKAFSTEEPCQSSPETVWKFSLSTTLE